MKKMIALVSILAFALVVLQGCAVYPPYEYSGGYNGYQSNGYYGSGRHHGWGGGHGWNRGGNGWGGHHGWGGGRDHD